MITLDIVEQLCKSHKITFAELERELGFSRGSIAKMKTSKPSTSRVQKIADYFGEPVDYLMTGKKSVPTTGDKEVDDFLCQVSKREAEDIIRLYQRYLEAAPDRQLAVEALLGWKRQES